MDVFCCRLVSSAFCPSFRVVCFATREDLERALDKLQGEDVNGRKLKLIDDSEKRSRSRSRDRKRDSRSRR